MSVQKKVGKMVDEKVESRAVLWEYEKVEKMVVH